MAKPLTTEELQQSLSNKYRAITLAIVAMALIGAFLLDTILDNQKIIRKNQKVIVKTVESNANAITEAVTKVMDEHNAEMGKEHDKTRQEELERDQQDAK